MQSTLVRFEVKKSALEQALILIRDFVKKVKENEPGIVLYHSFQDEENPCEFIHVISFADDAAEELHYQSDYCAKFSENILSLCSNEPDFQLFNMLC